MTPDARLAAEEYCYLTTTGRVTGKPHEIEIWFALESGVVYMLAGAGERSDWVRNLQRQPDVTLRIDGETFACRGRVVTDAAEDALARRLLVKEYTPRYHGDLADWGRTALPIAYDFEARGN